MIRRSQNVLNRMRIRMLPLLACLVCCTRLSAASTEAPGLPAAGHLDLKIDALLRGLADENFRVREQSSRELWELGEAALPALRKATSSDDPEQSVRARDLLRKIQLHITPDTDPSVILLVESYQKASPAEKASLLGKMRGKRAWRQMLKLYAAETDAELRERLSPMMGAVASKAARERLLLGDAQGAREFLEMAPADAANMLALAEFHRSHGTLDEELARANGVDRKAAAWRLALQRAAGNPAAARDEALAAGDKPLATIMAALAGDPLPFLREMRDNNANSPASAYANIAAKRWQGEKVRKSDMEFLTHKISSRDPSEHAGALGALFLLGEVEAAEPALLKSQPLAAFMHFEALERIPEAHRALGLDPEKPAYKPWVEKHLNRMMKEDIGEQTEVSDDADQLIVLANFLERRGLHEAAIQAFGDMLASMAKEDPEAYMKFLGRLFGNRETPSGAPRLARAISGTWAGDDAARWEDLRVAAFGDDESSREWWDWLAEIQPDSSPSVRFDAFLALKAIGQDTAGLRAKWMKLIWKSVEKADQGQRQESLERIAELAAETGDAATSMKAWDQLSPEGRDKIFWGLQIVLLTAADRWNDAAEVILKQIKTINEAKQEPTADIHAYAAATLRAAGRLDEAARHDRWADQLALGNAAVALRAGNGYAFGRDYQRAAEWWKRAAMHADPDSEELNQAAHLYANALLEQEKWLETASVSEIVAAICAGNEYQGVNQLPLMRQRLQADMARALSRLATDRADSLATLARCHRIFAKDGSLADFFFPALRKAGLIKEHDAWFLDSWNKMEEVIAFYPDCDNSHNTAAWFAARAMRKLDAAERHVRKALATSPCQSAYLDTMAEIQFARGQREKALEWSRLAVNFTPEDVLLRRQHERFRSEPFPR
jgi:tetratricopeptide (TPR) repeat protein